MRPVRRLHLQGVIDDGLRHLPTLAGLTPRRTATAVLDKPSAHARTICARWTNPLGSDRDTLYGRGMPPTRTVDAEAWILASVMYVSVHNS